ncbi:hypothetical protein KDL44_09855 [bacterium]|nr:hypothetical protein [bacterium]
MYKTICATLVTGLLLLAGSCNNGGPDPAEQMAQQYSGRSSSAPVSDSEGTAEDSGMARGAADLPGDEAAGADNPCGADAAANPCGEGAAEEANPCGEDAEAENPCAEAGEDNPCAADEAGKGEADNPCAADEAGEGEAENPCADDEAGEDEAENPCASDEDGEDEAGNPCAMDDGAEDGDDAAPLLDEDVEDSAEKDPIQAFMELDPRDILRAKQQDLESRLTSPWDEENPDEFIPETGRVDPLTIVDSAVPDQLKPPRSGSTDENEIELYLATVFATQTVDQVARALQCHSVIQIGVVSTAYFSLGTGEGAPRFSMTEGSSNGIGGAQVTCTGVSDTKVSVTISVPIPGNVISRNKVYIPRSLN